MNVYLKKMEFLRTFGIILLLMLLPGRICTAAEIETQAGHTGSYTEISCREGLSSCCLLQMIVLGGLDRFDPEDMLNLRIYSALLGQVKDITQEDLEHFTEEFDADPEPAKIEWYRVLADCLLADIRYRQKAAEPLTDPELVLLLFLEPGGEEEEAQRKEIRERITEETISVLAKSEGVTEEFVEWLVNQGPDP